MTMRHIVSVRSAKRGLILERNLVSLIRRSVRAVLEAESIPVECEVYVLYTDGKGIRQINLAHRGLDKPTDVLSFPLLSLSPGEKPENAPADVNPDTGAVPLGDIVLSVDHIFAQAARYGHGPEREAAFLTVHSMLHLLGYDHETGPEDEKRMFAMTEEILAGMGLAEE